MTSFQNTRDKIVNIKDCRSSGKKKSSHKKKRSTSKSPLSKAITTVRVVVEHKSNQNQKEQSTLKRPQSTQSYSDKSQVKAKLARPKSQLIRSNPIKMKSPNEQGLSKVIKVVPVEEITDNFRQLLQEQYQKQVQLSSNSNRNLKNNNKDYYCPLRMTIGEVEHPQIFKSQGNVNNRFTTLQQQQPLTSHTTINSFQNMETSNFPILMQQLNNDKGEQALKRLCDEYRLQYDSNKMKQQDNVV